MPRRSLSISVKDVNQQRFTKAFAKFLKKSGKVKVPEWADIVKTGCFKELAPFSENWYYVRVAAVARHLYVRSPAGVGSVRKIFGGRVNRGSRPSHYVKASGAVCRRALQTLETLKLVEKHPDGGRRLTSQGVRDLDRIAAQLRFKVNTPKSKSSKSKSGKSKRTTAGKVAKVKTVKKVGEKKPVDKKKTVEKKAPAAKKPADKKPKKDDKPADKKSEGK